MPKHNLIASDTGEAGTPSLETSSTTPGPPSDGTCHSRSFDRTLCPALPHICHLSKELLSENEAENDRGTSQNRSGRK